MIGYYEEDVENKICEHKTIDGLHAYSTKEDICCKFQDGSSYCVTKVPHMSEKDRAFLSLSQFGYKKEDDFIWFN